jgi:hypothetical protein
MGTDYTYTRGINLNRCKHMTSHSPTLVAALDRLEAGLPRMITDYPDEGDFGSPFAGEADVITENTTADDHAYQHGRIDCMLKNAGLIPGEDEGEPCK